MNYSRPGGRVSFSPATRPGSNAASRKFVSPDSPVTGRTVVLTIVPGLRGESIEKTGVLFFVGPRHVALREINGKNMMVCDINLIKIVNIYDAF